MPASAMGQSFCSSVQQVSVAQLLLSYLKLEGATKIFGVPGAAIMHVLDELKNQNTTFDYIVAKQETGAAFIADGYHRVSGNLGVVLATSGPGATNALTGSANAQASLSSLLTITGEIQEQFLGKGWEQEGVDVGLRIEETYASAASYSELVTAASNFQTLLTQALRIARGIPGQVAHLSLPDDIAATTLPQVTMPASWRNYRCVPETHDPLRTAQALDKLLAAQRPLIFLGNGCRQALTERPTGSVNAQASLSSRLESFLKFVERFEIPVMTTLDAKAVFPETHELSLRAYGVAGCTWPALYMKPQAGSPDAAAYDCLLVVGSTLNEFATNKWDPILIPAGPLVQVDIDQQVIARAMPVETGLIAEAGAFLDDLIAAGNERKHNPQTRDSRKRYLSWLKKNNSPYCDPAARKSDAVPIRPERLMGLISDLLPAGGNIFVDAGNSCGWSVHYLEIKPPSQIHAALQMGAMGYAVAGVIGGKLAAPTSTCVAICGDGGFLMHGAEISTARQYGAGAIWVVLSDNDLAMVSQGMNHFFPDPQGGWNDYYKLGNPDLVKYAEALGADACQVKSAGEFEQAFNRAVSGGQKGRPQVIVVRHDPKPMPPFYPPPTPQPQQPAPPPKTSAPSKKGKVRR